MNVEIDLVRSSDLVRACQGLTGSIHGWLGKHQGLITHTLPYISFTQSVYVYYTISVVFSVELKYFYLKYKKFRVTLNFVTPRFWFLPLFFII